MRKITSLLVVLFCLLPLWQTLAQEGNTCSDPIEIASLPYSTNDDTGSYTNEYSGPPGVGCGTASQYLSGNEAIYAYTATYTGELALTLNPEDTYAGFFVYNNCSDIGVVCASDGYAVNGNSTSELDIMISVESGETYYIVVSMWAEGDLDSYAYTLSVEEVSCSRPGLVTLESVGFGETVISWEGNADSYEYVLSTTSTEPTAPGTVTTDTEVVFNNLTEGQTYYFWVRSLCEGDDVSAWAAPVFFRSPGQGDTCGAAIEVASLPFTVTDHTNNFANEYTGTPGAACGTSSSYLDGNNVVYAYTATANTAVQILLESTAGNKGVFVYDDCESIGSLCNVGAVQSSGSQDITLDLYVETGETYYILLSTWPAPQTMPYTLSIEEITCAVPGDINLDVATPTTANFSWSGLDEADSYDYSISTSNAVPTAETGNTTESAIELTDLTPDTNYYFRVRTVCGDIATDWSEPFHFFTGYCSPTYTYTGDYISMLKFNSIIDVIEYTASSQPTGGYLNNSEVVLQVYEGQTVSFNSTYSSGVNGMKIWIDTNNNMQFEDLEVHYDGNSNNFSLSNNGQEGEITIPMGIENGNYRMRVRGVYGSSPTFNACDNQNHGSAIDFTIEVVDAPTCPHVENITLDAATPTTATISWDANADAEGYVIEYGIQGFEHGDGITVQQTETSIDLVDLFADTNYEFYVRADCGDDDLSYWGSPLRFFTGYCAPHYTSTSTNDYFTNITTEGGFIDIDYSTDSKPENGYDNQVNKQVVVAPGMDFDMTTTYQGGQNTVKAWVDWNGNMAFETAEVVYDQFSAAAVKTFTIEVPVDIEPGNYRIRVASRWGNNAIADPCGTYSLGSTVDFTLVVGEEPDCMPVTDLTVEAISFNEIIVSWEGPDNADTWEVEYVVDNGPQGSGVVETATTNTITIDGLEGDTDYAIYVTPVCEGEEGLTRMTTVFTGYCTPSTQWTSEYLSSISTEGALSDLDYSATSQPSGSYDNQSNIELVVLPGSQVYFSTIYSWNGTTGVNVWVDWDNSLTFDEDEKIYEFSGPATQSGVLDMPSDMEPGSYRMRVRGQFSGNPPPCGEVNYGSTVDFTLTILELDCMPALDITFTADASNNITMSWTGNEDVDEWEIEYGITGFTPGAGTTVTTTDTSYLFDDLEIDTEYDFYITGDCADEEGLTIGPVRFYFGYCTPSTQYGEYISSISTDGGFIDIDYAVTSQPVSGYDNQTDTQLVIIAGSSVELSTEYSYTFGSHGLNVWVDWNNSLTFEDAEQIYSHYGDASQTGTLDFPEEIDPGTYRMRVRGQWNNSPPACGEVNYGSTVDFTLVILDPSDCLPPLYFETTAVYMNAIEFTWEDNAENAESWEVEYGRRGFVQGEGTIVQTDTKPVLIDGLDSSSSGDYAEYDFYVRTICNGEETGSWSPFPHSEATLCGPTTIPYILDFEASVTPDIPPCSSQQVGSGSNSWYTESNPGYYLGETTVLRYQRSDTSAADAWFFTGAVELEAGEWYTISYDYMIGNPQFAESFKVAMGESANAAAMTTELADYPEITVGAVAQDNIEFRVDVDGVYYFGFHAYSDAAQFALFLDNIVIDYSLGVEDMKDITFTMYPNPASSDVQVQSSNTMQRITVYNMLGQTVENVTPMDVSYILNVESLQAGTYLLEVEADGKRQTKRLIKK